MRFHHCVILQKSVHSVIIRLTVFCASYGSVTYLAVATLTMCTVSIVMAAFYWLIKMIPIKRLKWFLCQTKHCGEIGTSNYAQSFAYYTQKNLCFSSHVLLTNLRFVGVAEAQNKSLLVIMKRSAFSIRTISCLIVVTDCSIRVY